MSFLPLNNGENFFVGEDAKTAIYNLLTEKTKNLDHKMSFKEACDDPEMVHPNQYAYFFGSFDKAAEMAWREAQSSTEDDDDIVIKVSSAKLEEMRARQKARKGQEKEKPQRKPTNYLSWAQRSSPWENRKKVREQKKPPSNPDPSRVKYDRNEVIKNLSEFYYKYGGLPTVAECNLGMHNLPSDTMMRQLFGTRDHWLEIIKENNSHTSSKKENNVP